MMSVERLECWHRLLAIVEAAGLWLKFRAHHPVHDLTLKSFRHRQV